MMKHCSCSIIIIQKRCGVSCNVEIERDDGSHWGLMNLPNYESLFGWDLELKSLLSWARVSVAPVTQVILLEKNSKNFFVVDCGTIYTANFQLCPIHLSWPQIRLKKN